VVLSLMPASKGTEPGTSGVLLTNVNIVAEPRVRGSRGNLGRWILECALLGKDAGAQRQSSSTRPVWARISLEPKS
jgi:hypothetical protein